MNGLVIEVIGLYSFNLHGHRYLNFLLVALMEIPGGLFGGIFANKFGRRWVQVLSFFFCALACLVSAYFSASEPSDDKTATLFIIIFANLAK